MKSSNLTGVWIGLAAALAAVSAFIRIPTQPVPLTMQVLVIFLLPVIFGGKISFYGMLLYISLGLIGFSVFANGGGIGYLLSPTFGYLLGFLLSTIPVGFIYQKMKGLKKYPLSGVVFLLITYSIGSMWLYVSINYFQNKEMSLKTAITVGILAYIIPDTIKIVAATIIAPILQKIFFGLKWKKDSVKDREIKDV